MAPPGVAPYALGLDVGAWHNLLSYLGWTANFHVASTLLLKVLKLNALSWFQLVLAATYSGAFHPTAEGQAAIADAVVDKARSVLKKYAAPERSRAGVEEPTTHAAGSPVE